MKKRVKVKLLHWLSAYSGRDSIELEVDENTIALDVKKLLGSMLNLSRWGELIVICDDVAVDDASRVRDCSELKVIPSVSGGTN